MVFVCAEVCELVNSVVTGKRLLVKFPRHQLSSRLSYLELEDFVELAGLNWGAQDDDIIVSVGPLPFSLN